MAETPLQKAQRELHNRISGEIVASIVKPPLATGGSFTDVLVLLESVITGVIVTTVRMGGDNIVVDAVIDRVRVRAKQALAEQRLGPMSTKGNA